MYGLYESSWIVQVSIRMEKTVRLRFAAIHPLEIAHEVSNWLGIAGKEPGLRDRKVSQIAYSSARGADDSCKRRSVYRSQLRIGLQTRW